MTPSYCEKGVNQANATLFLCVCFFRYFVTRRPSSWTSRAREGVGCLGSARCFFMFFRFPFYFLVRIGMRGIRKGFGKIVRSSVRSLPFPAHQKRRANFDLLNQLVLKIFFRLIIE